MTIFYLPDLGEGLPEAEIHEWFIKEGDEVKKDQPIVAMETAKAVVEVPAPQSGVIKKLYGDIGTLIKTGQPLMEFISQEKPSSSTVVGQLEEQQDVGLQHLQSAASAKPGLPKATFAVKKLALEYGVNLENVLGSGPFGVITADDIKKHASTPSKQTIPSEDVRVEPLIGVRRQMMKTMQQSHQEVVPVSIYDEADITHWKKPFDITVRLIEAICYAVSQEPGLNAWFKGEEKHIFKNVNLGLAVDSSDGLFVPIIKNANQLSSQEIRKEIERCKQGVADRSLAPDAFQNGTIILSNFGRFAGKFANPIIVPPMVAIIAVGRLFDSVVSTKDGFAAHTKLPISLTFDHRPLTGGEATRFLGAMIKHLED
jgi:2-oxoisovalerate dehydrogenase E2 component (dihydrolipoyl transacylase)